METQVWALGSWEEYLELKGKKEGLILAMNTIKSIVSAEEEPIQKY